MMRSVLLLSEQGVFSVTAFLPAVLRLYVSDSDSTCWRIGREALTAGENIEFKYGAG